MAARAVRVIDLGENGAPIHAGLLVVEPGTRLVFTMRPTPKVAFSTLLIWTNCPVDNSAPFRRHSFTCLEGDDTGDELNPSGDWAAFLEVTVPGSFEFFAEFERGEEVPSPRAAASNASLSGGGLGMTAHGVLRSSSLHAGAVRRASVSSSSAGSVRRSASGRDFAAIEPPARTRRGPVGRFIVNPDLFVRLTRSVSTQMRDAFGRGARTRASASEVAPLLELCADHLPRATGIATVEEEEAAARRATDIEDAAEEVAAAAMSGAPIDDGIDEEEEDSIDIEDDDVCARSVVDELLPGLALPRGVTTETLVLPLPLDGLSLQTQLTRCLGPIDGWLRYVDAELAAAQAESDPVGVRYDDESATLACAPHAAMRTLAVSGTLAEPLASKYSMLHFTPPQRLGDSGSCYSLRDVTMLNWDLFVGNVAVARALATVLASTAVPPVPGAPEDLFYAHPIVEGAKSAVLGRLVNELETRHGVLSMVDVVLNHTATSTPWLRAHPEATYSLRNSPHLRAAFDLDEVMLRASSAIARGAVPGVSPRMDSEAAVNAAVDVFESDPSLGVRAVRIWERYVCDVRGTLAAAATLVPGLVDDAVLASTAEDLSPSGCEVDASLPAPFTPNVVPCDLSPARRFELAALADSSIRSVLSALDSARCALVESSHALVSDAALARVAAALSAQPSAPPVEEAVSRLKSGAVNLWREASLRETTDTSPVGEDQVSPPPTSTYGKSTSEAFFFGRPSAPSAPFPPPSRPAPLLVPDADFFLKSREHTPRGGSATGAKEQRPLSPVFSSTSASSGSSESVEDLRLAGFSGGVYNDGTGARFCVHLDIEAATAALSTLPGVLVSPRDWRESAAPPPTSEPPLNGALPLLPSLLLLERLVNMINLNLYKRYDEDIAAAINAVRGTAQYTWLSQLRGAESISDERPIVWSYFARVPGALGATRARSPQYTHVLACNGFIWNGDPEIDFTLPCDAARTYAEIVRAGTEENEFLIKLPRGTHAPPSSVPLQPTSPATAESSKPPFVGADLLDFPPKLLAELCAAYSSGDATAVDELEAEHAANVAFATIREAAAVVDVDDSSTPRSPPCTPQWDQDAVPHLRPDVVPLALVSASTPYMRRDLVVWGDCVKLRYGLSPGDSPWLWAKMRRYVRRMALIFHALRIDNAHSTPLHVAAYMIDAAREVRPNLYVNAELFTGSLARDVDYVSRLGISSLVREAMSASSPGELTHSVFSYGGTPLASLRPPLRGGSTAARVEELLAAGGMSTSPLPVSDDGPSMSSSWLLANLLETPYCSRYGSRFGTPIDSPSRDARHAPRTLDISCCVNGFNLASLGAGSAFSQSPYVVKAPPTLYDDPTEVAVANVLPAPLAAIFFDCSHDNETPAQKRHACDALSTMAIVTATACASGSVRGYDDLVPENISVVHDLRRYGDERSACGGALLAHWSALGSSSGFRDGLFFTGAPPAAFHPSPSFAPCLGDGVRFTVDMSRGLRLVRRRLNVLKAEMAARGHTEVHVSASPAPRGADVITVVRGHPSLPSCIIFIARSAFSKDAGDASAADGGPLPTIRFEGRIASVVLAATLSIPLQSIRRRPEKGGSGAASPATALADPAHPSNIIAASSRAGSDASMPPAAASLLRAARVRVPGVERTAEPVSSTSLVDAGVWDAHPSRINGLACTLMYADDCGEGVGGGDDAAFASGTASVVGGSSLLGDALGLASFREQEVDGHVVSLVTLDAARFRPGSILVLRAWQPRNVALRAGAPASAQRALDVPTTPLPSFSDGATTPATPGSSNARQQRPTPPTTAILRGWSDVEGGTNGLLATLPPASLRLATSPSSRRLLGAAIAAAAGPSTADLRAALAGVSLVSLNAFLYRSDAEEREASRGARGVYTVPGLGPLPWAGIAGPASALRHCRRWNDLGHPLLENLRAGAWLLDYTVSRLDDEPALSRARSWLAAHAAILRAMPPSLRPQGFDRIVSTANHVAEEAALARMPGRLLRLGVGGRAAANFAVLTRAESASDISDAFYFKGDAGADVLDTGSGSVPASPKPAPLLTEGQTDASAAPPLVVALALTSVMFFGFSRGAPLLERALLVDDPGDGGVPSAVDGLETWAYGPSLAAGVDHFCVGYMRTWGRDTFISLRGLLLVTGRWAEARALLVSFAALARHGLLPNLGDSGRAPRYNCRDAAWWWLQALQDYTILAPEGTRILTARVRRRFPSTDRAHYAGSPPAPPGDYIPQGAAARAGVGVWASGSPPLSASVGDIAHEIMSAHARGIDFVEWGAGPAIDAHMKTDGFRVTATLDPVTGFVSGGNAANCGTWMDKMGSAEGLNRGEPATPRDGAAIEIVALVHSAASWLAATHVNSPEHFPFSSVSVRNDAGFDTPLRYDEWAGRIAANFERSFFVPVSAASDDSFRIRRDWVNKRGIYKDTVGSSAGWADYALRPNALVAMVVAPSLFTPSRADAALCAIERALLGGDAQLGVKTLDPDDWAFRGAYNNAAQSDRTTAHGWNYHQGPEWLWPYGFYLRARMRFPPRGAWPSYTDMRRWVHARLARQRVHLESSAEGALPELTQAGGARCADSCVAQAWSSATLLDALHDCHIDFAPRKQL